jgi:hypothetical protein
MWQCSGGSREAKTKLGYRMRLAPRERSVYATQLGCFSSVPLPQLWTESFYLSKWIIVLLWSAGESSTGDVPILPISIDGHLHGPPLPPLGHNPIVVPPQQPLIPGRSGSDHFSVDDHSVHTPLHSATDHLTVDDVSDTPSSRGSSRRSASVKTHLSPDDESVISSEKFQRSQEEPSDADISSHVRQIVQAILLRHGWQILQVWIPSFHVQQHEITLRQDTF